MKEKVLFSWSGGKDCAFALYHLLNDVDKYELVGLLTTVTADYDRVSMHGFRTQLLDQQADLLNLPLRKLTIAATDSKSDYEKKMNDILQDVKAHGINTIAFGDIFLADLRAYRENNLAQLAMQALFPLWEMNTATLAKQFIAAGFKTIITCVDTQALPASFAGREYDEEFLADLPAGVDPCGENGEFHSFVYAGPIFAQPIAIAVGERVMRDERYCFCDVVPVE